MLRQPGCVPGRGARRAAIGVSLAAGLVLAAAIVPAADHWQDRATALAHEDSG